MAWSESLLEARFRDAVFDVLKTDDDIGRATAEHAYPYVDGAAIEDLGRTPRRISLDAVFYGDDYEARLETFLKALHEKPGAGELIHPVFGSLSVQLVSSRLHHEADNVDQVQVALEFIETLAPRPFFARAVASQQAAGVGVSGAPAQAASIAALGDVVGRLRAALPLAALNDLRSAMLGPVLAGLAVVRGITTSGLDVLSFPRAWASDIAAIADGMLDLRDFAMTPLADFVAVNRALSRFDVFSHRDVTVAPLRAGVTPTEPQALAATQAHLAVTAALGTANAAALVLGTEADSPTLSPPEIESVVNAARSRLESCIEAVRAIHTLETARSITEPLKDTALALQDAARTIIEARPPLLRRRVEAPGNLRLLAHRWYADHARAPELWRLNPSLRQPNTIQTGDALNGYAH